VTPLLGFKYRPRTEAFVPVTKPLNPPVMFSYVVFAKVCTETELVTRLGKKGDTPDSMKTVPEGVWTVPPMLEYRSKVRV
jgi:hypothetical protein